MDELEIEDAFVKAWTLQMQRRPEEAEPIFRSVLCVKPDHEGALRQLGIMLCETKRWEEAEPLLRLALAYEPAEARTHTALGGLLASTGRYTESITALDRALELSPDQPAAHYNRATPRLLLGDWPAGFYDYEWGKVCQVRTPLRFLQPEWDGMPDIVGKSVYVWSEQGVGDTIMALQLLALLKQRNRPARILLEVRRELLPILHGNDLADEVIAYPDDNHRPRDFDVHVSLMSLPSKLSLIRADLPAATNYIVPPLLNAKGHNAFRVGVCWKGNSSHPNDRNRSLSQEEFWTGIPEREDMHIVNLTYDEAIKENAWMPAPPSNWAVTAQRIASLDIVVTVDSAVAHLVGAMGIPCFTLIPAIPDWRWGLEHCRTPWYPSMRLCRQETMGGWCGPLARIHEALLEMTTDEAEDVGV